MALNRCDADGEFICHLRLGQALGFQFLHISSCLCCGGAPKLFAFRLCANQALLCAFNQKVTFKFSHSAQYLHSHFASRTSQINAT